MKSDVNTLRAWDEAGRRLRDVDPDEYNRLIALARAFIKVHDEPAVSDLEFRALCAAIRASKATA